MDNNLEKITKHINELRDAIKDDRFTHIAIFYHMLLIFENLVNEIQDISSFVDECDCDEQEDDFSDEYPEDLKNFSASKFIVFGRLGSYPYPEHFDIKDSEKLKIWMDAIDAERKAKKDKQ